VLNHGGDEALAAFALCEVVAGDAPSLAELAGQPVPDDAPYALIETDRVPATVRFARVPTEAVSPMKGWEADADAQVDAMIRAHRDALTALVLPDRAALVRYAAQAEAADPAAASAVRGALDRSPPDTLARVPAVLALAAADGRADPARAAAALAESGRAAWVSRVVPGSRWARSGGCGLEIEGAPDNLGVDCGMGHVAAKAVRMLYFFDDALR
jgi:hypothetical protein